MAFTLNSDLNGASPQFTLTCISTGGPATTVTWTRDSVTVTEGNETVLDNRETSQYTHTLTVTGRLGGLYTCTVANNKPSEDSASYTVKGAICYVHIGGRNGEHQGHVPPHAIIILDIVPPLSLLVDISEGTTHFIVRIFQVNWDRANNTRFVCSTVKIEMC